MQWASGAGLQEVAWEPEWGGGLMTVRFLDLLLEGDTLDFRGRFLVKSRTQAVSRKVAAHFPHVWAFQNLIFDPLIKATKYDLVELKFKKNFFKLRVSGRIICLSDFYISKSDYLTGGVCILYWQVLGKMYLHFLNGDFWNSGLWVFFSVHKSHRLWTFVFCSAFIYPTNIRGMFALSQALDLSLEKQKWEWQFLQWANRGK